MSILSIAAALLLHASPAFDALERDAPEKTGSIAWPVSSAFSASLLGAGTGLAIGTLALGGLPNRMQSNMAPAALIGFTGVGLVSSAIAGWALGTWAREGSSGGKVLVWILHCVVMTAASVGIWAALVVSAIHPQPASTPFGP